MANKLKKIFSKEGSLLHGDFSFKDNKAREDFNNALQAVFQKGEAIHVDGVEKISVSFNTGLHYFPLTNENEKIVDVLVAPVKERMEYSLDIDGNKISFPLEVTRIDNGYIINTENNYIIHLKMTVNLANKNTKVEITPDYEKAESIIDIIDSLKKTIAFIKRFFPEETTRSSEEFLIIMKHLEQTHFIFSMAQFVQDKFNSHFDIHQINLNDQKSIMDLYELCLAVRNRLAIRINAKLTATESTGMELQGDCKLEMNNEILLAYSGTINYLIWGLTFNVHSANLLIHAVVKRIESLENGNTRVIYGDTEQNPMYISYKAFLTEDEAKKELKDIIHHKVEYENAKSVVSYWQDFVCSFDKQ